MLGTWRHVHSEPVYYTAGRKKRRYPALKQSQPTAMRHTRSFHWSTHCYHRACKMAQGQTRWGPEWGPFLDVKGKEGTTSTGLFSDLHIYTMAFVCLRTYNTCNNTILKLQVASTTVAFYHSFLLDTKGILFMQLSSGGLSSVHNQSPPVFETASME